MVDKAKVQFLLKNVPGLAWLAGSFTAAGIYVYPDTIGISRNLDKPLGKTEAVDQETLFLVEEVKRDLKWSSKNIMFAGMREPLRFIQTTNSEFCTRGSTQFQWGALVGLPILFSSQSLRSAQDYPETLLKYNIDLRTDKGRELFNTFKLSTAAKKFALAREICYAESSLVNFNFFGTSITLLGWYALSKALYQQFRFRGARVLSCITVIPTLTLGYLKLSDYYHCYVDAKTDKTAASISKEVAEGGIEYYMALIDRRQNLEQVNVNHIVSSSIGAKFEWLWRKKGLSLTDRKASLEKLCETMYPESVAD